MTRTVSRLYDSYSQAQRAVEALENAGFTASEVSLISRYRDDNTLADDASGAATGATAGAVAGGTAGLLAALGVIAIPGIGPLVGGLLGALTDYGVSEEEAHVYSEGIRRGSSLVTVRADDERVSRAEAILDSHQPVNTRQRRDAYAKSGWSKYDPASKGYTAEEIRQERERYLR